MSPLSDLRCNTASYSRYWCRGPFWTGCLFSPPTFAIHFFLATGISSARIRSDLLTTARPVLHDAARALLRVATLNLKRRRGEAVDGVGPGRHFGLSYHEGESYG